MATESVKSTSASDSKDKKKTNDEPQIEFAQDKKFPEEIKEEVRKILIPLLKDPKPTTIAKNLVTGLNKKFGAAWNAIVGGHFSTSFTYIEGMYTEIKVQDLLISVWKIYVPPK